MKNSGFKLIGLQLPYKTSNINGQSNMDCGKLWQKFEKEEVAQKIPNKLNKAIYAVYFDYGGDHTQPFSYFIGCKVKVDADVPDGLQSLAIPQQQYEKVEAKGKMPDCIAQTWREIWNSKMARSYQYDFEVYDERSQNWEDAEVDIYLGVKDEG